ncbi:hypothetical protein EDD86DRAFT_243717 [Gorgonomyces haynaldii]|nr:hypothetical protein EDD86DRAFT_243717 [Gorgonomyces haynaldii]
MNAAKKKQIQVLLREVSDQDPIYISQLQKNHSIESIADDPVVSSQEKCKMYLEQRYKLLRDLDGHQSNLLVVLRWKKQQWIKMVKEGQDVKQGQLWDVSNVDVDTFLDDLDSKSMISKSPVETLDKPMGKELLNQFFKEKDPQFLLLQQESSKPPRMERTNSKPQLKIDIPATTVESDRRSALVERSPSHVLPERVKSARSMEQLIEAQKQPVEKTPTTEPKLLDPRKLDRELSVKQRTRSISEIQRTSVSPDTKSPMKKENERKDSDKKETEKREIDKSDRKDYDKTDKRETERKDSDRKEHEKKDSIKEKESMRAPIREISVGSSALIDMRPAHLKRESFAISERSVETDDHSGLDPVHYEPQVIYLPRVLPSELARIKHMYNQIKELKHEKGGPLRRHMNNLKQIYTHQIELLKEYTKSTRVVELIQEQDRKLEQITSTVEAMRQHTKQVEQLSERIQALGKQMEPMYASTLDMMDHIPKLGFWTSLGYALFAYLLHSAGVIFWFFYSIGKTLRVFNTTDT